MLKGQNDQKARLWFGGTLLYATVVSLFVFSPYIPPWISGSLVSTLAASSVFCFIESLRQELSSKSTPWAIYLWLLALWFGLTLAFFENETFAPYARAGHLYAIAIAELYLVFLINKVRLSTHSLAMWVLLFTFLAFALSNLSRALEFTLSGHFFFLQDFTIAGRFALVMNYVSAIFYCYGYWGFMNEKNRSQLIHATETAVLAQAAEHQAIERELLAEQQHQERTTLMEQLSAIGKIAQSGALSATIAHEINQPLTSVQLNAQEAQHLLSNDPRSTHLPRLLERIVYDNQRAATIIQRLRGMFGRNRQKLGKFQLDDLVRFVADISRARFLKEGIQLRLQLNAPSAFDFTPGELEHALLNLLDNAIHALQNVLESERWVEISTWENDNFTYMAVSDNGPGIPEDLQKNIFDLSQSASNSQGMGLGLWLAEHIIERHHGTISFDSQYVNGARFIVKCPRH